MSAKRAVQSTDAETSVDWRGTLAKALQSGAEWPDKDELLDVLYWGRQILALFIGIAFGLAPVYGIFGIISYVAISTIAGQHYVVNFQKVDEDLLGGYWEIAKEGFGAAFATFMVAWITVYSFVHFS